MTVLCIGHGAAHLPGLVGRCMEDRGLEVSMLRADQVTEYPDPGSFDAVVVLGSVESVHDARVPWLPAERRFVERTVSVGTPVLGVCFGGQLLADVLGGRVAPMGHVEIGWVHIDSADAAIVPTGRWFEWHRDAYTLPPGARELGRTSSGTQAFVLGPHLGLQFHPEVDRSIVAQWCEDEERRGAISASLGRALRVGTAVRAPQALPRTRILVDAFLDRAACGEDVRAETDAGTSPT